MKTSKFERKGSRKALLIGLPLKLAFCFLLVYFSGEPYYLLNSVIRSIGLLHPFIWIGSILLTLIVLFWIQGKKITKNLNKNFSPVKASLCFSVVINAWFCGLLFLLNAISLIITGPSPVFGLNLSLVFILGTLSIIFGATTVLETFTTGLLLIYSIKNTAVYRN